MGKKKNQNHFICFEVINFYYGKVKKSLKKKERNYFKHHKCQIKSIVVKSIASPLEFRILLFQNTIKKP